MSRTGDSDRSFRYAVAMVAVLLATSYLIFSAVFSHLAPLGIWKNQIFDKPAWSEHDPHGPYVDSAHQLTWGEGQLFEGHPGTVLILLLSGVQHAYYGVAESESGFSFTEFTARNLPTVFLLSKLMMTMLHLMACFATFLLAKALLRDERAAAFSALGYATSLPVCYYLSRISVEPIVVICFTLSLLAIWRYQALALEGRVASALGFAALSAFAATSGVATKFNFLAPLLPFLALYLLLGGWREGSGRRLAWRQRGLGLLAFGAAAISSGMFYSQFIDWRAFFQVWRMLMHAPQPAPWTIATWLPGFTPARAFALCDLVYIVLGAVGWVAFLRGNPQQRMRTLWLSAYGAFGLLLFGYRASLLGTFLGFHYFNLSNVVVAVFFGHALMLALRRLPVPDAGWRAAALGIFAIALIHAATFITVIDSRRKDAAFYRPSREIHQLIAQLEPHQQLACAGCPKQREKPGAFFALHTLAWTTGVRPAARSRLAIEFESLFVPVRAADLGPRAKRTSVQVQNLKFVVATQPTGARRPQRRRTPDRQRGAR